MYRKFHVETSLRRKIHFRIECVCIMYMFVLHSKPHRHFEEVIRLDEKRPIKQPLPTISVQTPFYTLHCSDSKFGMFTIVYRWLNYLIDRRMNKSLSYLNTQKSFCVKWSFPLFNHHLHCICLHWRFLQLNACFANAVNRKYHIFRFDFNYHNNDDYSPHQFFNPTHTCPRLLYRAVATQ